MCIKIKEIIIYKKKILDTPAALQCWRTGEVEGKLDCAKRKKVTKPKEI